MAKKNAGKVYYILLLQYNFYRIIVFWKEFEIIYSPRNRINLIEVLIFV